MNAIQSGCGHKFNHCAFAFDINNSTAAPNVATRERTVYLTELNSLERAVFVQKQLQESEFNEFGEKQDTMVFGGRTICKLGFAKMLGIDRSTLHDHQKQLSGQMAGRDASCSKGSAH